MNNSEDSQAKILEAFDDIRELDEVSIHFESGASIAFETPITIDRPISAIIAKRFGYFQGQDNRPDARLNLEKISIITMKLPKELRFFDLEATALDIYLKNGIRLTVKAVYVGISPEIGFLFSEENVMILLEEPDAVLNWGKEFPKNQKESKQKE
jgi:hypothetical protein